MSTIKVYKKVFEFHEADASRSVCILPGPAPQCRGMVLFDKLQDARLFVSIELRSWPLQVCAAGKGIVQTLLAMLWGFLSATCWPLNWKLFMLR